MKSLIRKLTPVAGLLAGFVTALAAIPPPGDFGTKAYPQMSQDEWNAVVAHPGFVPGDAGQYIIDTDQCWSDPAVLYAGQDTGGVRTTFDHGQTWWTLPNHGLVSTFINGIAVDPLNPKRVLAISNAAGSGEDVCGLSMTTDGGLNWTRRIPSAYNTERGRVHLAGYARSTMDAAQNKTLRAYFIKLAWDVDSPGGALGPNHELWTTADGGDTWTLVRYLSSATYGALNRLVVDPSNPAKVYISGSSIWRLEDATNEFGVITKISGAGGLPDKGVTVSLYISPDGQTLIGGLSASGIYKSVNGGANWTRTLNKTTAFFLFINPFDPSRMIMMYGKNNGVLQYSKNGDSAAPTFTTRADAPQYPDATTDAPIDESYGNVTWLADNPDAVIAHGRTKWWRSLDGGVTWVVANSGFNGRNHTNFRPGSQFFDPTNPDRFILPMVDFGLRYTDSRGRWFGESSITAAMVGASTATCNGGAIHPDPAKKTIVVACAEQSRQVLLYSNDNGDTFTVVSPVRKRRQFVGFDRDNPQYAFNADERSTDDGATWTAIPFLTANNAVMWDMTLNAPGMANGQAIFATDINASSKNVWRSMDRGDNWELVLTTDYTLKPEAVLLNVPFKVHPANPNIIWTVDSTKTKPAKWDLTVGTPSTRVPETFDLPGILPPDFTVLFIDIDPKVPSVMYVAGWGEHSGAKLWRSTDSGATWLNLSNDLAGISYKGLAISPVTGEVFMSSPTGGIVIPPPYATSNTVGEQLPWGSYNIQYDQPVAPVIGTAILPDAVAGVPYSETLAATGAGGSLAWNLPSGSSLPSGLSLSSAGVISGTASAAGTKTFIAKVQYAGALDGAAGSDTRALTLTIAAATAPALTQQPLPQHVTAGESATFTVAATSNAPLSYQWRHDGAPIVGNPSATTATLNLASVHLVDAGAYDCVVSSTAGSVTSESAALTVDAIAVTVSLGDLDTVYDGSPKAASVTTAPEDVTVALTYDGNATAPTDAGSYPVVATVTQADYVGSASGTLVIAKATPGIFLGNLATTYDGTPKPVSVTTAPGGLPYVVSYDASTTPPTDAGSYTVIATVNEANYAGSAGSTLVIAQAPASLALTPLVQPYDGTPRVVTATSTPVGLPVTVTYNGAAAAPTLPGVYPVEATVDDPNYTGAVQETLQVTITALVRHAPSFNGRLDGSLQLATGEGFPLNSGAFLSGDLLTPGTANVQVNGHPTYAGVQNVSGAPAPTNYTITLNSGASLRYLVRRVDPLALPVVTAPATPAGTRNVTRNQPTDPVGDFATVRNLTLNSNGGSVAVPPGVYGELTANGSSSFVLGTANATEPAVYELQRLTLNGTASLQIAGPVILKVANAISLNGTLGSAGNAELLELVVTNGGVTLNSNARLHAIVTAPNGTVTVNSNAILTGRITADRLTLNGTGLLDDPSL